VLKILLSGLNFRKDDEVARVIYGVVSKDPTVSQSLRMGHSTKFNLISTLEVVSYQAYKSIGLQYNILSILQFTVLRNTPVDNISYQIL